MISTGVKPAAAADFRAAGAATATAASENPPVWVSGGGEGVRSAAPAESNAPVVARGLRETSRGEVSTLENSVVRIAIFGGAGGRTGRTSLKLSVLGGGAAGVPGSWKVGSAGGALTVAAAGRSNEILGAAGRGRET